MGTQMCNTEKCPDDCKVGDWKPWNQCSVTCGNGTKTRSREVVQEPGYRGTECPILEETQMCNTEKCPVDCKVGDWKQCSATCGNGTKTRSREVVQEPENGGTECPILEETQMCNTEKCPGDEPEWKTSKNEFSDSECSNLGYVPN